MLVFVSLVACSSALSTPSQTVVEGRTNVPPAVPPTPAQTTMSNAADETQIRDLVENFGNKLKLVSLLAPNSAQDLQRQYADFVSLPLLESWRNDVSKAPGRMVSSPWPDRIEITTLSKEDSDRYAVTGLVIEITSTEIGTHKAAAKIPVHMVLQKEQGRWLITAYTEEQ